MTKARVGSRGGSGWLGREWTGGTGGRRVEREVDDWSGSGWAEQVIEMGASGENEARG
ncbi:hypothetical protein CE91St44_35490 [Oscillospiraceae bacterium]|nr:hypothetical protein CE91St44_35490 [Oscillospiraceae bacterium]